MPKELMPRRFFITFDKNYENKWQGCLTIGQHSYLWSSADVGDAHLLDTELCETLEEAIVVLKAKMLELWRASPFAPYYFTSLSVFINASN